MKYRKKLTCLALALTLIFSLTTGASAADATREQITAYLNYNITVTYNGETQVLADANGNQVYPVTYSGTTYVPIRAIGNLLGLKVDWDQSTQTVLLADPAKGETVSFTVVEDDSPARSGMEEIRPYIEPDITVKYNGVVQAMKDANGNRVYPVLYNGTTYLPIRATANMLSSITVGWEQATQTVTLTTTKADNAANISGQGGTTVFDSKGHIAKIDRNDPEGAAEIMRNAGFSEDYIKSVIGTVSNKDPLRGYKTSSDAKVLGENHIGYNWVEIDWSTAADSYVRVKLNELPGPSAMGRCQVKWAEDGNSRSDKAYDLTHTGWTNIPLYGGSTEYAVSVMLMFEACEHYMTEDELAAAYEWPNTLTARFDAEIGNPDNVWLLSTPNVDFDNAPKTRAKALELTKNCKTDAEKITAVFNYVSTTIRYDYDRYNDIIARTIKARTTNPTPCMFDEENGEHIVFDEALMHYYDLDAALDRKSGVCENYATLMAGMLRSVGVPCKVVSGSVRTDKRIKDYCENGWEGHAWVAVNPKTGSLNKTALGAGKDFAYSTNSEKAEPTGWTRLDPTHASSKAHAANDDNYFSSWYY